MRTEYTPKQIERFWNWVDFSGGPYACWPWTGFLDRNGYGRFVSSIDGAKFQYFAHRLMWYFAYGLPDPKLHVLHSCDNPACVNPRHLSLGTQADNVHDMIAKGRDFCLKKGENKPRGHKRPDNSLRSNESHVMCKYSNEMVAEMRKRYDAGGVTAAQLGREYGMSGEYAWLIVKRKCRPEIHPAP